MRNSFRPPVNGSKQSFIFCTGIENSYPVIKGPNGRPKRIDQMELCGHYELWREDFRLVRELGLDHLRYGPRISAGTSDQENTIGRLLTIPSKSCKIWALRRSPTVKGSVWRVRMIDKPVIIKR